MNAVELIGGSGAGKSALVQRLAVLWPGHAAHLRTNRYLRDRRPSDGSDFIMRPDSVDWPLVKLHIEMLSRGERVIMPDYEWTTGRRLPPRLSQTANLSLDPSDLLLIETLHLTPGIQSTKIFVDAPLAYRRANIQKRDAELSGNFAGHFDNVTEPGYQKYTAPLRDKCDLVVDGTVSTQVLVGQVKAYLAARWGSWG